MKTILFTASLLFAPLCLADTEREHLIYEADSFVNTELRCPSPDGTAELVYRGLRHAVLVNSLNDIWSLLRCGADTSTKDDAGRTPLDLARKLNRTELIPLLQNTQNK